MISIRVRTAAMALAFGVTTMAMPLAGSAQESNEVDLAAVKQYAVDQAASQKAATEILRQTAQQFFDLAEAHDFDYAALWDAESESLTTLLTDAKAQWLEASTHYELNEGLVAGVPSLSYYDVWMDAGPSAAEDPQNALEWTLDLPNGGTLESPGNFFHHLTEPALWGTEPEFVGLEVDFDGDASTELGEVLPDANFFLGSVAGLDDATTEMQGAIDEWEPTLEDAFGALITMVPTMNEYFEQWKNSAFVAGNEATEDSFVATSRLFDVNGILQGLSFTYDELSPLVAVQDPELDSLIKTEFGDLIDLVSGLYQQEVDGKRFTAEEADLYGGEAQERADRLAGQVAQAAALVGVEVS